MEASIIGGISPNPSSRQASIRLVFYPPTIETIYFNGNILNNDFYGIPCNNRGISAGHGEWLHSHLVLVWQTASLRHRTCLAGHGRGGVGAIAAALS